MLQIYVAVTSGSTGPSMPRARSCAASQFMRSPFACAPLPVISIASHCRYGTGTTWNRTLLSACYVPCRMRSLETVPRTRAL